jgi:hypothetical protein
MTLVEGLRQRDQIRKPRLGYIVDACGRANIQDLNVTLKWAKTEKRLELSGFGHL